MTRDELEAEVYTIMGLLDPTTGGISSATPTGLRTYVQNKIQGALNTIVSGSRAQHRRKPFAVLVKAPSTGTLTFTTLTNTAIWAGSTVDDTWIGGHVVLSNNGYPLRVESYVGQTLTFTEYIMAPSGTAVAATMYFDGVMFPATCQAIEPGTVKLAGKSFLKAITKNELEKKQGYYGLEGTDYGFGGSLSAGNSVIGTPDIGQPTVYCTWGNVRVSSIDRRIVNLYPYPETNYTLQFDGFKKPALLTTGSGVPDIPEQFHQTVLVPRLKLDMCEYPAFELSSDEKNLLEESYDINLLKFLSEDNQDPGGDEAWGPSSMAQ